MSVMDCITSSFLVQGAKESDGQQKILHHRRGSTMSKSSICRYFEK